MNFSKTTPLVSPSANHVIHHVSNVMAQPFHNVKSVKMDIISMVPPAEPAISSAKPVLVVQLLLAQNVTSRSISTVLENVCRSALMETTVMPQILSTQSAHFVLLA